MHASVRILAGLAIGIVVCFIAATVAAIGLGLAQTYFAGHGIETPYLTREYTYRGIRISGADVILVGSSLGLGLLAMGIWFFATGRSKRDSAAFSGAGVITAADSPPTKPNSRE